MLDNILWIVVGGLLTIPIAIFTNLITDPIKNWLAKRSQSSAKKRIEQLEGNVLFIEALDRSASKYYRYVFYRIGEIALWVSISLTASAAGLLTIAVSDDLLPFRTYVRLARATGLSDVTNSERLFFRLSTSMVDVVRNATQIGSESFQRYYYLFSSLFILLVFFIAYISGALAMRNAMFLRLSLKRVANFKNYRQYVELQIDNLAKRVEKMSVED